MPLLHDKTHTGRFCLLLLGVLISAWAFAAGSTDPSTISFGRFGQVALYTPQGTPENVVLLISGEGGWAKDMDRIARTMADGKTVIAGIDINAYLKQLENSSQACSYPAGDFELLSKFIQKKLNMPRYLTPVLTGYSAGAALAYATLAQAPAHTFQGAIGLAFCPEVAVRKPICNNGSLQTEPLAGKPGYKLLPSQKLSAPWVILQGGNDRVCSIASINRFVPPAGSGKLAVLPGVGHELASANWQAQYSEAMASLRAHATQASPTPDKLSDLPLIEVSMRRGQGDTMAVILSGDGGWASIDRELGNELAKRGLPVIGFNSLQYFWKPRRPDGMAQDLTRILRHYSDVLDKKRIILIGYSLGADVLPFMASRLPDDIYSHIDSIVLISPGERASFEFYLGDWLGSSDNKDSQPIQPEVEKLIGPRIVCIYGTEEAHTLCRKQINAKVNWKTAPVKGGHHLDGDYRGLADLFYQPNEHSMLFQKLD